MAETNFRLLVEKEAEPVFCLDDGLANAFIRMRSFISNERLDEARELTIDGRDGRSLLLVSWVGDASCVGDDMEEVVTDEEDDVEEDEDEEGVSRPVVGSFLAELVKSDLEMGDVDDGDDVSLVSDFSSIMLEMDRWAHQCSRSNGTNPFRCGYSVVASSTWR